MARGINEIGTKGSLETETRMETNVPHITRINNPEGYSVGRLW